MTKPPFPENEEQRLQALKSYNILDTFPEKELNDIVNIASSICGTSISLVSLVDRNRQWFKAKMNFTLDETPREISFCTHAILNPKEVMVVPDASKDERFVDSPLVTSEPHIAFYAGAPLVDSEGNAVGTLCVMDDHPHNLTKQQVGALKALANQVVSFMELRKSMILLERTKKELEDSNLMLSRFAHEVSHDLKAPLRGIKHIAEWMHKEYYEKLDKNGREYLNILQSRAEKMSAMISGILDYSESTTVINKNKEKVNLSTLLSEITDLLEPPENFSIIFNKDLPDITVNKVALVQVLINLLSNAIKYNDKERGTAVIEFFDRKNYNVFEITDNGLGIPEEYHDFIFEPFKTLGKKDRFSIEGTGLGLAIVKRLVNLMGGKIKIESKKNVGTTFNFSIKK